MAHISFLKSNNDSTKYRQSEILRKTNSEYMKYFKREKYKWRINIKWMEINCVSFEAFYSMNRRRKNKTYPLAEWHNWILTASTQYMCVKCIYLVFLANKIYIINYKASYWYLLFVFLDSVHSLSYMCHPSCFTVIKCQFHLKTTQMIIEFAVKNLFLWMQTFIRPCIHNAVRLKI